MCGIEYRMENQKKKKKSKHWYNNILVYFKRPEEDKIHVDLTFIQK